jgi:hypothetical protein
VTSTKKNLHHIRLDPWMSEGIRALKLSHGNDSKVIRAAVEDYLEKYGITEEAWLLRQHNTPTDGK